MTSPISPSPRRKRRVTWRRILLGLLVLIILSATVGYFLIYATPKWYQPVSADDPNIDDYATSAQSQFLKLRNAVGQLPLGERTWTVSQDQLNAFLTATYGSPGQADPHRPAPISGPMILFSPGTITLAARTPKAPSRDPDGGVVSIELSVQTIPAPDGSAGNMGLIKLKSVWLGTLPQPPSIVRSRTEQMELALEPAIRQAMRHYLGPTAATADTPQVIATVNHALRGEPFPLTFTGNHRTIIIKDVHITDGQFSLTLAPGPTRKL